jgi:nucleotide-binding universal stress UspA family protein
MFQRILVPLDGSKLGEFALPYAAELAAAFGSDVDLLHVDDTKSPERQHMNQIYLEKMAERMLEMTRNFSPVEANPARANPVIRDGEPAAQTIEYAEKSGVNLLIIVSHGRSGIMPWSMGSTAARILQRTGKPVLFIRAQETVTPTGFDSMFRRIILPLDGSTNGEAALPYIKALTTRIASELTFFRVIAPGYHIPTIGGLNYVSLPKAEIDRLSDEARQYLDRISAEVEGSRATIKLEVRVGDAASEIIKFATEQDFNLIALSSHGYSDVDRWTFGSVTHKVLHSSRTPVLLMRARFK